MVQWQVKDDPLKSDSQAYGSRQMVTWEAVDDLLGCERGSHGS